MGTPIAPHREMPRSANVHSRRVDAMIETISPFFTPSAIRPQAASSLSLASCAQVASCQLPETLRRAAVRCASVATRCRKSWATDWMAASSLRCFCIAPRCVCAVAMPELLLLRGVGRSVRFDPVAGLLLHPPFLGGIVARRGVEHLTDELHPFFSLVRVGVAVGQADLRAQVVRMGADGFGQDLEGLVHVPLRPG